MCYLYPIGAHFQIDSKIYNLTSVSLTATLFLIPSHFNKCKLEPVVSGNLQFYKKYGVPKSSIFKNKPLLKETNLLGYELRI